MKMADEEVSLRLSAPAEAFDNFIGTEGKDSDDIRRCHVLWRKARRDITQRDDPTPFAHNFLKLTTETLLLCIYQRMKNTAANHADPERITRIAGQGFVHSAAFAPAYAEVNK